MKHWTHDEWMAEGSSTRDLTGDHTVEGRSGYFYVVITGGGSLTVKGGGDAVSHGGDAIARGGNAIARGGNATSYGGDATSYGGNATSYGGNARAYDGGNATSLGGNAYAFDGGTETDDKGTRQPVKESGIENYDVLAGDGWLRVEYELHTYTHWMTNTYRIAEEYGEGIAHLTRALAERLEGDSQA